MFPDNKKIFSRSEKSLIFCYLDAVRGSPRLEVEGNCVRSGECLDGADSRSSPVVLDGVTIARYLGGALPDAHVHRVPGVLEP